MGRFVTEHDPSVPTSAAGLPWKLGGITPASETSREALSTETKTRTSRPGPQPTTVLLGWPFRGPLSAVPVHSVAVHAWKVPISKREGCT